MNLSTLAISIMSLSIIACSYVEQAAVTKATSPPPSLVGLWGNSDDHGQSVWGFDQFNADGTTLSWGVIPDTYADFRIDGTYEISDTTDKTLCTTITKSTIPQIMPIGSIWCDQIISINENELLYIDGEGQQNILYRQKVGKAYY
ncbi:hypothetical protein AHAT_28910 [Agarivorans sp. Toyoura001]|uniref:hypothetical protein n=1 Tax=Agarivorans sp. Toyoura001 TaxID=2283141 RepID=UPI0010ED5D91|nr:hypothetical protein [Agarivorans sp. Toyoura001]GDY27001.1 hypothetical protein AHAT_28910 [Agarivorans sp. Toyoura001]